MAKVKRRMTKNLEMDHVGYLPDWHSIDSYEDEKFPEMLNDALRHYGYFTPIVTMRKSMLEWLKLNEPDPKLLESYKKSLDWRTPVPAYSLAMANLAGMPMKPEHFEYIMKNVHDVISHNKADGVVKAEVKKDAPAKLQLVSAKLDRYMTNVTIQDRITAKVDEHILHIEETFEDGIIERKEKHPKPEIKAYLATEAVPPSTVKRIVEHFEAQLKEITEAKAKDADEDLKEAYAHIKPADLKRYVTFYTALLEDMNMYKEEKKVARAPRQRKAQPKHKQVAKVNYLKKHDGLKLVSINPEDVIDCKELWVYQTKYRKLGKYVAQSHSSLGVKGTTITGFDINGSVQKTLRKPKEQLAEFKKAGKVKLRTFMDEVKAVDIKLTGRINKDTILLKVF